MLKKSGAFLLALTMTTFLLVGCGKKEEGGGETDAGAAGKQTYTATGDEGGITGVVNFEGTPPAGRKIDMSQDPNCVSAPGDKMTDDTIVTDGKLANVLVYVKGGDLDKYRFTAPSEPVVLDQVGCRYTPRTLGLMVGQTLRVTNSDPTTHNVHPTPKNNEDWNKAQTQGAPPIEAKFNRPETMIPVKCNQHPWMKANLNVLAHPFFAVTGKDGSFTIKDLPPGSYTLVAWHETLGEQTMNITVGAKETKSQDFTYRAGQAYAPTSMKVGPAFIVP